MTIIVFCNDPLHPRRPDEMYLGEVEAAKAAGFNHALISYEALVNENDAPRAVDRIPEVQPPQPGIYRGWMLRPAQYSDLYQALFRKGIQLVNNPAEYVHCHHLPESYPVIEAFTPNSVWRRVSDGVSPHDLANLLQPFDGKPIIVKDFVKSQKHYWAEACFIPSAADRDAVARVVNKFLELQGDTLNEGLVFREFVEFEPLAPHSKSNMPLTKEFRIFVLDGVPLAAVEYWEEGDYKGVEPPVDDFRATMRNVKSRFFTMDIAKRKGGAWMIVELGDAQVAGLPDKVDAQKFYQRLFEKV